MPLRTPEPVATIELFEPLQVELDALMSSLSAEEWKLPTACSLWCVKDLAAHLLDTDLRRLSLHRDQHLLEAPDGTFATHESLVSWLNELNAQWTTAAERLSPAVLISLLTWTGPQVRDLFSSLDPLAPAQWPVAWAGENESPNWFDIAREYTEKWLHQQQMREATGRPLLDSPRFLDPVLRTFVRSLPHAYRSARYERETEVSFVITGPAGSEWTLVSTEAEWQLMMGEASDPAAWVRLDQDTAWRLFSRGLSRDEAIERIRLEGHRPLAEVALQSLAIMA